MVEPGVTRARFLFVRVGDRLGRAKRLGSEPHGIVPFSARHRGSACGHPAGHVLTHFRCVPHASASVCGRQQAASARTKKQTATPVASAPSLRTLLTTSWFYRENIPGRAACRPVIDVISGLRQ